MYGNNRTTVNSIMHLHLLITVLLGNSRFIFQHLESREYM